MLLKSTWDSSQAIAAIRLLAEQKIFLESKHWRLKFDDEVILDMDSSILSLLFHAICDKQLIIQEIDQRFDHFYTPLDVFEVLHSICLCENSPPYVFDICRRVERKIIIISGIDNIPIENNFIAAKWNISIKETLKLFCSSAGKQLQPEEVNKGTIMDIVRSICFRNDIPCPRDTDSSSIEDIDLLHQQLEELGKRSKGAFEFMMGLQSTLQEFKFVSQNNIRSQSKMFEDFKDAALLTTSSESLSIAVLQFVGILENDLKHEPQDGELNNWLLKVLDIVIQKLRHFSLRYNQEVAVMAALETTQSDYKYFSGRGLFEEIGTGEGKTLIVICVAIILARQGKRVHILTSSPVLAKRDAEGCKDIYEVFEVSADHICYKSEQQRRNVYRSAQVIYGDISSFQRDFLLDSYYERNIGILPLDTVLVDEVDSMLLDQDGNVLYLSHDIPDLEFLQTLLVRIWQQTCACLKASDKTISENSSQEMATKITRKVRNALMPSLDRNNFGRLFGNDEKTGKLCQILERENVIDENGVLLDLYLEKEDWKRKLEAEEDIPKVEFCLHQLKEKFEELCVPQHLWSFVLSHFDGFVENAIQARFMEEGYQYKADVIPSGTMIHHEPRIVIIDRCTGVDLPSTQWSNGLHQFLQLKHGLRLTPISLKGVFISNVSYIKKYKYNYGFSGTLGTKSEQEQLTSNYGAWCMKIPPSLPKLFYEEESVICTTEIENKNEPGQVGHASAIYRSIIDKLEANRAVLIICESIKQVDILSQQMRDLATKDDHIFKEYFSEQKVVLYRRDYEEFRFGNGAEIPCMQIILATNLAGRGTDLKLHEDLKNNGGLHVIVTFLPGNLRVQEQAFGRAARCGERGSAQLIVLNKDFKDAEHIWELKMHQSVLEARRIEAAKRCWKNIVMQEQCLEKFTRCFQDCITANKGAIYQSRKRGFTEQQRKLLERDLLDKWAFWLDKNVNFENDFKGNKKVDEDLLNHETNFLAEKFTSDLYEENQQGIPTRPMNRLNWGIHNMMQKNWRKAVDDFDYVLRKFPFFDTEACYYKAVTCIKEIFRSTDFEKKTNEIRANFEIARCGFNARIQQCLTDRAVVDFFKKIRQPHFVNDRFSVQQLEKARMYEIFITGIDGVLGDYVSYDDLVTEKITHEVANALYRRLSKQKNCFSALREPVPMIQRTFLNQDELDNQSLNAQNLSANGEATIRKTLNDSKPPIIRPARFSATFKAVIDDDAMSKKAYDAKFTRFTSNNSLPFSAETVLKRLRRLWKHCGDEITFEDVFNVFPRPNVDGFWDKLKCKGYLQNSHSCTFINEAKCGTTIESANPNLGLLNPELSKKLLEDKSIESSMPSEEKFCVVWKQQHAFQVEFKNNINEKENLKDIGVLFTTEWAEFSKLSGGEEFNEYSSVGKDDFVAAGIPEHDADMILTLLQNEHMPLTRSNPESKIYYLVESISLANLRDELKIALPKMQFYHDTVAKVIEHRCAYVLEFRKACQAFNNRKPINITLPSRSQASAGQFADLMSLGILEQANVELHNSSRETIRKCLRKVLSKLSKDIKQNAISTSASAPLNLEGQNRPETSYDMIGTNLDFVVEEIFEILSDKQGVINEHSDISLEVVELSQAMAEARLIAPQCRYAVFGATRVLKIVRSTNWKLKIWNVRKLRYIALLAMAELACGVALSFLSGAFPPAPCLSAFLVSNGLSTARYIIQSLTGDNPGSFRSYKRRNLISGIISAILKPDELKDALIEFATSDDFSSDIKAIWNAVMKSFNAEEGVQMTNFRERSFANVKLNNVLEIPTPSRLYTSIKQSAIKPFRDQLFDQARDALEAKDTVSAIQDAFKQLGFNAKCSILYNFDYFLQALNKTIANLCNEFVAKFETDDFFTNTMQIDPNKVGSYIQEQLSDADVLKRRITSAVLKAICYSKDSTESSIQPTQELSFDQLEQNTKRLIDEFRVKIAKRFGEQIEAYLGPPLETLALLKLERMIGADGLGTFNQLRAMLQRRPRKAAIPADDTERLPALVLNKHQIHFEYLLKSRAEKTRSPMTLAELAIRGLHFDVAASKALEILLGKKHNSIVIVNGEGEEIYGELDSTDDSKVLVDARRRLRSGRFPFGLDFFIAVRQEDLHTWLYDELRRKAPERMKIFSNAELFRSALSEKIEAQEEFQARFHETWFSLRLEPSETINGLNFDDPQDVMKCFSATTEEKPQPQGTSMSVNSLETPENAELKKRILEFCREMAQFLTRKRVDDIFVFALRKPSGPLSLVVCCKKQKTYSLSDTEIISLISRKAKEAGYMNIALARFKMTPPNGFTVRRGNLATSVALKAAELRDSIVSALVVTACETECDNCKPKRDSTLYTYSVSPSDVEIEFTADISLKA